MSMNIGQAALNAVVAESEFLVVEPEQVQNCGMQVPKVNFFTYSSRFGVIGVVIHGRRRRSLLVSN
jgi:hypothetical protein